MKGLVLKDLYSVKKYMRQYVLFFAVFTVVGIMLKMPAYIGFLGAFYGMSLFISTFNTDEFFHWEAYEMCIRDSRSTVRMAKECLMCILCPCSLFFGPDCRKNLQRESRFCLRPSSHSCGIVPGT